jgi:hypothetical protein
MHRLPDNSNPIRLKTTRSVDAGLLLTRFAVGFAMRIDERAEGSRRLVISPFVSIADAGLEELLDSLANTPNSPNVVLQVVLSALSKLDPADREQVIQQLLTLNRPE